MNQIGRCVDAERNRDERAAPGIGALHLESARHLFPDCHLKTVELVALQSRQRRILRAYTQIWDAQEYVVRGIGGHSVDLATGTARSSQRSDVVAGHIGDLTLL